MDSTFEEGRKTDWLYWQDQRHENFTRGTKFNQCNTKTYFKKTKKKQKKQEEARKIKK